MSRRDGGNATLLPAYRKECGTSSTGIRYRSPANIEHDDDVVHLVRTNDGDETKRWAVREARKAISCSICLPLFI